MLILLHLARQVSSRFSLEVSLKKLKKPPGPIQAPFPASDLGPLPFVLGRDFSRDGHRAASGVDRLNTQAAGALLSTPGGRLSFHLQPLRLKCEDGVKLE